MTRFAFDTLQHEAQKAIATEGLRPFVRRTGLAMGVVRSIADGRDMSVSSTLAVAEALGYEVAVQPKKFAQGLGEPPATSDFSSQNAVRSGFLPIPWHEELGFKGSAPVAFSSSWLASEGLLVDFLKAVSPTEVSFSFANAKNTVAVLDTNAAQKGAGSYWCYRDGTTIGICRAAFHEEIIILFSGDEDGAIRVVARPLPTGFRILGRVAWLGVLPRPIQNEL